MSRFSLQNWKSDVPSHIITCPFQVPGTMFINNTTITSRWSSYSLLWTASGMAAAVLAVTATMGGAVVPMCLNLINMIGFLYPAMKSLRSMNKLYVNGKSSRPISTKNVEEKQPTDAYYHLVYFMMYALFHIVEDSGILLVQITASYCWFKGLLLLWMAHPKIQGSRVVFRVLLSEEAMIVYHSISKLAQYAMENTQQAWDRVWRGKSRATTRETSTWCSPHNHLMTPISRLLYLCTRSYCFRS